MEQAFEALQMQFGSASSWRTTIQGYPAKEACLSGEPGAEAFLLRMSTGLLTTSRRRLSVWRLLNPALCV